MFRRLGFVVPLVGALLFAGSINAFAAQEQANGTGKTAAGATLGFNAQADLTGNFEYQTADGLFNIHCNDYSMYMSGTTTAGFPKAWFASDNCWDKLGVQYHLVADLIDRGEGANALQDGGSIAFRILGTGVRVILDRGHIQNGNIQIHS
jgi:hypothetical protein